MSAPDGMLCLSTIIAIGFYIYERRNANGLRKLCSSQFQELQVKRARLIERDAEVVSLRNANVSLHLDVDTAKALADEMHKENLAWRKAKAQQDALLRGAN